MHPSQVARASGLRARLGGGLNFKPGDVSYFRSNPGLGWVLANAAQNIDSTQYSKFRLDAKGLYTVTQPNITADAQNILIKSAFRNPSDGLVYFQQNNLRDLYKKPGPLLDSTLVSTVPNPSGYWDASSYRFLGFQNGLAIYVANEANNSGYWGVWYSTNPGFTTWASTFMSAAQTVKIGDVLWTGNRWLVAGSGLFVGNTLNNTMTRPTHLSGPLNVNSVVWGKLWKVGSAIYAWASGGEVIAKSTDDGLSWTTYIPTNTPYRMTDVASTVIYSPTYDIWFGITGGNVLVYAIDPTGTWTTLSAAGIVNSGYGIGLVDMLDPGGVMLATHQGLHFINMASPQNVQSISSMGLYGFGGSSYQSPTLFLDNSMLTWCGYNTRWYRCYSPLERCNPPTLAAIGDRTPYMRVAP